MTGRCGAGASRARAGPLNDQLWHLGFNRIDKLNEQLVAGREEPRFPARQLRVVPGARCFGWYRALEMTIAQDEQRQTGRLAMPVPTRLRQPSRIGATHPELAEPCAFVEDELLPLGIAPVEPSSFGLALGPHRPRS